MEQQYWDAILVPIGVGMLVAYHLWFLHRVIYKANKTYLGINAINRRVWVEFMMEDPAKTGILAVQTLRNNIMASSLICTMVIMLCYLIAILMANGWGTTVTATNDIIVGNTSSAILSIKFFSILACFLLAFLFNVQSIRYYSHAGILINVPIKRWRGPHLIDADYVTSALNRGSYFWSLGLKALYFSFPLFLWMFGPVPMFVCCVVMVILLYFLDVSLEKKSTGGEESGVLDRVLGQC